MTEPYPLSILGYRPVQCAWCGQKLACRESASHFTVWCWNLACGKHNFPFHYPQIEAEKEAA